MLRFLRKITPKWILSLYHGFLSWLAATWYGNPSRRLIVIGVTGTNGKSSTAYFLAHALEAAGAKTGMTSTAMFKVADREWTNATKMTMLGRFQLQKLLREMVDAGCAYAVVETSSQGIVQHRHRHIAYDGCVFTNLTPEHIEAHGGFENYKRAKASLFSFVASLPLKVIHGTGIPRIAILNRDDEHAEDMAYAWGSGKVVWYGMGENVSRRASNVHIEPNRALFDVNGQRCVLRTPGEVMVYNALAALTTAEAYGISMSEAIESLSLLKAMPGRYESINEGQPFTVIVDYAYEPVALEKLLAFARTLKQDGRIIHVTGSAGGGRDVARRSVIGELSAREADITIVTNEDPYDEDPMAIITQVADAAAKAGKADGTTLFRILDREEAVRKAVSLAQPGDVVLITGKGSEPVMAVAGGKKILWDDREEVRKALGR